MKRLRLWMKGRYRSPRVGATERLIRNSHHAGTKDEPGIFGALRKRRELIEGEPMIGFECSIFVPDVDAVATAVVANGGTIVMPKATIPAVGHVIWFRDTEGNVVGAMQPDPGSKDAD